MTFQKCLFYFLISNLLILSVTCGLLKLYHKYPDLKIFDHHEATFNVSESFTIDGRYHNPVTICGVTCNANPECGIFGLNISANSCTLYSDQLSLMYTQKSINLSLYSQNLLDTCIKDHYPDYENLVCIQKNSFEGSCNETQQCSEKRGLDCDISMKSCQCKNPDYKYWSAAQDKCLQRKKNGTTCTASEECIVSKGLDCLSGICQCNMTNENYYSPENMICMARKNYGDRCFHDNECFTNLNQACTNRYCGCDDKTIWSDIQQACLSVEIDSLILTTNTERENLKSLIGFEKKSFVLLYRGTRDGFKGINFHEHADGVNNTLTIVKSKQGNVFGGFLADDWKCSITGGYYYPDPQSFLFTLINTYNAPQKNYAKHNDRFQGYHHCGLGPTFGGHDLYLADNMNTTTNSYVSLNSGYDSPTGGYASRHELYNGGSQYFKVVELEVYATFSNEPLVIDSTILSTDTLKNNLRELIGFQNKEFRLLMRASRDGFTDGAYHGRVDGAEQTLLVIKSDSDYIFGGYLEYMKDKVSKWKHDSQAFVYSLTNPSNEAQIRPIITDKYAAYFGTGYGPSPLFGEGYDIKLVENCNTNSDSNFLSNSYKIPDGSTNANIFFVGSEYFKVSEVEHFAISPINKLEIDSTILTNDEIKNDLRTLIGFENKEFRLRYRGTRDGFSLRDFHYRAFNRAKTVYIAKCTNGYVFGGYSKQPIGTAVGWFRDSSAFLFSLINPSNVPFKRTINVGSEDRAVHLDLDYYVALFGNGWDFHISGDSNSNNNSHHTPSTYAMPGDTDTMYTGSKHFKLVELEFYEVLTIKPLIFNKIDSLILDESQKNMLRELIGFQNKEFTLIYRATRDGFAANNFHRRCDYQPRTLTIIKSSNGYIFGGFAMAELTPSAGFITDPYAFVFTLVNPTNQPLKLPIVGEGTYALYSRVDYGPSFGSKGGSGHGLFIKDNSDVNVGSFMQGGYSYECPLGKCDRAGEDFFNDNYRNWYTAEIETYLID